MAEHDEGRPGRERLNVEHYYDYVSMPPPAELAWRIGALRIEAGRTRSGWLRVQLLDFADLLEAAEARGWFE